MVAVFVHPAALDELVEAAAFYEDQSPGLGRAFLEEVARGWAAIGENLDIAAVLEPPYRRFNCRRFPFSVIYREIPEGVRVLATTHQRRHPGYWRYRG